MRICTLVLFLTSSLSFASAQENPPRLEEYFVQPIALEKQTKVVLKRGTPYWRFRTRIREGAKEEPNFAGHYIIVQWGCGTECQSGVMIDALSGKIHDFPVTSRGAMHQRDSNLLIVNPWYENASMSFIPTEYFLWDGEEFKLLYTEEHQEQLQ